MSETQPSSGSPAEKSLAQIARVRTLHLQRAKDAGEKFSMLTSYDTLTAAMKDHVLASGQIIGLGEKDPQAPPPAPPPPAQK